MSLLAEIGGYTGLLLGASVANLTVIIDRINQYIGRAPVQLSSSGLGQRTWVMPRAKEHNISLERNSFDLSGCFKSKQDFKVLKAPL